MKNRIKKIRLDKGLTQAQLAEMAGITRPALSAIENEKSVPDGTTIVALVKALGTPASEIFFELDVV